MNKFFLILVIFLFGKTASAQITYQSGSYGKQKQRTQTVIAGNLVDKFSKNGFNWLLVQNNGKLYTINVVDSILYKNFERQKWVVLNNCFKIDTEKSNMKY